LSLFYEKLERVKTGKTKPANQVKAACLHMSQNISRKITLEKKLLRF
jgi:hypothetical protein